jgi:hypothetical protein
MPKKYIKNYINCYLNMYLQYSFYLTEHNISIIRYIHIETGNIKKIEDLDTSDIILNKNDDIYTSKNMIILKACFISKELNNFSNINDEDINLLKQKSLIYEEFLNTNNIYFFVRVFILKNKIYEGKHDVELFRINENTLQLIPLGYNNILIPPNWDIKLFFSQFNSRYINNKYMKIINLVKDLKNNLNII